jgi:hypothetical protein
MFEYLFILVLELLAMFDQVGDVVLLIALFRSEHSIWFSLSAITMLAPFFVCYVPLLTF